MSICVAADSSVMERTIVKVFNTLSFKALSCESVLSVPQYDRRWVYACAWPMLGTTLRDYDDRIHDLIWVSRTGNREETAISVVRLTVLREVAQRIGLPVFRVVFVSEEERTRDLAGRLGVQSCGYSLRGILRAVFLPPDDDGSRSQALAGLRLDQLYLACLTQLLHGLKNAEVRADLLNRKELEALFKSIVSHFRAMEQNDLTRNVINAGEGAVLIAKGKAHVTAADTERWTEMHDGAILHKEKLLRELNPRT